MIWLEHISLFLLTVGAIVILCELFFVPDNGELPFIAKIALGVFLAGVIGILLYCTIDIENIFGR